MLRGRSKWGQGLMRKMLALALSGAMVIGFVPVSVLAETVQVLETSQLDTLTEISTDSQVEEPSHIEEEATDEDAESSGADLAQSDVVETELSTTIDGSVFSEVEQVNVAPVEGNTESGDSASDAVAVVAEGNCGTCPWSLDSDGTLTIGAGTLASNDERRADFWPWYEYRTSIKTVVFVDAVEVAGSLNSIFSGCSYLTSLDLSNWDTSAVRSMRAMFNDCSSLVSLDLSGWDTSSVTDMAYMFHGCSSLVTLDLSGWDTSKVTDTYKMFYSCLRLCSLDLSGWDTSSVADMRYMFSECSSLAHLDLSDWRAPSVRYTSYMFSGCSSLMSLDLSSLDMSSATSLSYMFYGCSSLSSIDLTGWNTSSVTNMSWMFRDCSSLVSLNLSEWDTSNVTDMGVMFSRCSSLTFLDVSSWNTSSVRNMRTMFHDCSSLSSLDLSCWDTSNVTDVGSMFSGCASLASLDLSSWNTFSVETGSFMYSGCTQLAWWRVGPSYRVVSAEMVPQATSPSGNWFSVSDGRWYTSKEISASRSAVADTYTSKGSETTDLAYALIDSVPQQVYSGSRLEPGVTVTLGGKMLVAGTDYVVSFSGNRGPGVASAKVTGTGYYGGEKTLTFRIVPAAPALSSATPGSATTVGISWQAPAGTDFVEVWRSTDPSCAYGLKSTVCIGIYHAADGRSTSKLLTPGTTYYYKVRGYAKVDGKRCYSGYSRVLSARTPAPSAPTGVTATRKSSTTVGITWRAPEGATFVEVWRSTDPSCAYGLKSTVCIGIYNASDGASTSKLLTPGTTYYYKCRAYHRTPAGRRVYSGYSPVVSATPR